MTGKPSWTGRLVNAAIIILSLGLHHQLVSSFVHSSLVISKTNYLATTQQTTRSGRGSSSINARPLYAAAANDGSAIRGKNWIVDPAILQDNLLTGTSLEGKQLECIYKATQDGWSAIAFHEAVDERGSCLVVCQGKQGFFGRPIFGGFNPLGWRSSDDYGTSTSAFLWFQAGGAKKFEKCPVLRGGNAAIFDYATGGPIFGAADLVIGSPRAAVMGGFAGPDLMDSSINAGNLKEGSSSVGGAYEATNGWPMRGSFSLSEMEVYCNTDIKKPSSSGGGWWPF